MLYLFDAAEKLVRPIPTEWVREAHSREEINRAKSLEVIFNGGADLSRAVFIGELRGGDTLDLYKIISIERGDVLRLEGIEAAYDELGADGYVQDKRPENRPLQMVIGDVLSGSRWGVGAVYVETAITTNFYYLSRLDSLRKLAEITGCELTFSSKFDGNKIYDRRVNAFARIGKDRGRRFEHGHNLLHVVREEQRDEIYTAIVGRGKGLRGFDEDGKETGDLGRRLSFKTVKWTKSKGAPADKPLGDEILELPEATAAYGLPHGKPRVAVVEFDNIEDPKLLLEQSYKTLVEYARPLITYSANVRDIGAVALGDIVTIIRDDLGIRYKIRIYSRERNLLKPDDIVLRMGDREVSQSERRLQALEARLQDYIEENATGKVMQVVEAVGKTFWGLDSYNYTLKKGNEYGLPPGYYSFDRPINDNPTELIYIGAGRMYISNQKTPEGEWIFKTIGTGSGFYAEEMFAGSFIGDVAKLGYIEADMVKLQKGGQLTTLDASLLTMESSITTHGTRLNNLETANINLISNTLELSDQQAQFVERLDKVDGADGSIAEVERSVATLNAQMIEISKKQTAMETGQGNLLLNPQFGTGDRPEGEYWSSGLTWREMSVRRVTWKALKDNSKTWSVVKRGWA